MRRVAGMSLMVVFAAWLPARAMFARAVYLDLMECAVAAYDDSRLCRYLDEVKSGGLGEHGFGRLAANLGVLIAHDRLTDKKPLLAEIMDEYCRQVPTALANRGGKVGNDFSVREVVAGVWELERSGAFPKSVTDTWRRQLSSLAVKDTYTYIYPFENKGGVERAHNWAVFAAASEQSRLAFGMGGSVAFVDRQLGSQLRFFDENGMYRDPGAPIVYDIVTRLQFAAALHYGYKGAHRAEVERKLLVSAEPTLLMQSVTGEIPYGGRSNQFLHNETAYAALCEWYAAYFNKRGDKVKAQRFRAAARRAVESLAYWTRQKGFGHVKNRYPVKPVGDGSAPGHYGCERYAYFDKYMVTMGSWAYLAYLFADESVPAADLPDENAPMAFKTSQAFHLVLLKAGGYGVQFDSPADANYDGDGIGRIQCAGFPPALCLSTPFAAEPKFYLDMTNETALAILPGWRDGGEWRYASAGTFMMPKVRVEGDTARAGFDVRREGFAPLLFACSVSSEGVELTVSGAGELALVLPVFTFDGKTHTIRRMEARKLMVAYHDAICVYSTNGEFTDTGKIYANRNGHYTRYEARGWDCLRVHVSFARD